ncbi:MAG: hypothetical protein ACI8S6_001938 [Myxococcota bacterium]|jgi:hypothetical protein
MLLMLTGTITDIVVTPDGRMPRSHITVTPTAGGPPVVVTVPGANGPPLQVGGLPIFHTGEQWSFSLEAARAGWVPRGLGRGAVPISVLPPPPYNLNGLTYPASALPLPFWLNDAGSSELGVDETEEIVQAALSAWSTVGCADFGLSYAGRTEARFDDDGMNVLSWEEESWEWGGSVAGFTATRFGAKPDGAVVPVGADIVFNAVDWSWVAGPGDAYARPATLSASSVILHELGHATGMDHEYTLVASTMFFAYIGGDWQGSLSGDDRRGLCENYPSGTDECASDADCADIDDQERACVSIDGVSVCDEVRDPAGAFCSRTDFNCAEFCVFTDTAATEGYCAPACEDDSDCAEGTICDTARSFLYNDPDTEEQLCVLGERTEDTAEDTAPPKTHDSKKTGCQYLPASIEWWSLSLLVIWGRRRNSGEETR